MKTFLPFLAACLVLVMAAEAAPKIGTIRASEVFRDLPSTKALGLEMKNQGRLIMEDQRSVKLRAIIEDLKTLETELRSKREELNKPEGEELIRKFELRRQEAETLRLEFESFRQSERDRINRYMVAQTKDALARIVLVAKEIGFDQSLDVIFDTSGTTNTGIPVLVHKRNQLDLTALAKERINATNAEQAAMQRIELLEADDTLSTNKESNPVLPNSPEGDRDVENARQENHKAAETPVATD